MDKSLAQAKATATGTRYRLQQAIRAYAREQLASSGEMDGVQARHGAYFARLGEQAAHRLNRPDQAAWATRLDQEQANLRAAWLWSAADPARAMTGLTMVSGLWEYWLIRGLLDQGAAWLEDALRRAAGPPGARADALAGLAVITCLRGDVQRGGDLFAASIALHEQAGNWAGHSRALALLGFWRANQGDQAGSAAALDRAMLSAGLSRDPYFAAFTLLMAGMAALLTGRIPLARARASESGRLFADIGGRRGAGYARCVVADCLIHEGSPAECLLLLRECIQDFETLLDRWGLLRHLLGGPGPRRARRLGPGGVRAGRGRQHERADRRPSLPGRPGRYRRRGREDGGRAGSLRGHRAPGGPRGGPRRPDRRRPGAGRAGGSAVRAG